MPPCTASIDMLQITLPIALLIGTLLVALRLAPVFLFAPVFGTFKLPPMMRVFLVLGLAFLLTLGLSLDAGLTQTSFGFLLAAAMGELLIGAAIASGLMAAFAAFAFAGRILDLQIGLGVASLFDPVTRASTPLIGTLLSMMAVMVFYSVDAHHLLLRAFAFSFEQIPPGAGISRLNVMALVMQGGLVFSYGLALIAPVVFILFLVDMGLAVLSRTMPQMNIFFLGIAVKVVAGFLLLALSIRYMGPAILKVFGSAFKTFEQALG
jgi:flagellar biosynthetic protein FliR